MVLLMEIPWDEKEHLCPYCKNNIFKIQTWNPFQIVIICIKCKKSHYLDSIMAMKFSHIRETVESDE